MSQPGARLTRNAATLLERVADELEPNASYWRRGRDDPSKYFLEPEVVDHIAWASLNIVLPILTGVSANILTEILRRSLSRSDEDANAETSVSLVPDVNDSTPKAKEAATEALRAYLSEHGWPERDASQDAVRVVDLAIQSFGEDDF